MRSAPSASGNFRTVRVSTSSVLLSSDGVRVVAAGCGPRAALVPAALMSSGAVDVPPPRRLALMLHLSPYSRNLGRSGRSEPTTHHELVATGLTSAVSLSSIFWHRSLRHSRVRSHHPRVLLTRVKNLCLDNEFAESKEDRWNLDVP
jgi:hypothetical protein